MEKKILVTSTWDNNYKLLNFFINFYNSYWENPSFLFICGYRENEKKEILENFSHKNIKFKRMSTLLRYNDIFAKNIKLYRHERYFLITYKTFKNKKSFDWLRLRKNLFMKIFSKRMFTKYDYYLNTDNDDYFYVKNVKEYLDNYSSNSEEYEHFHTLEFIPHKSFSENSDLEFISYPYYYMDKAQNKMKNENSHNYCRRINLNDRYLNEIHVGTDVLKIKNCSNFKTKYTKFEEIDRACFAFGVLDLDYLLNTKQFVQATDDYDKKEAFELTNDEIVEKFYNHYLLNKEEREQYKIFNLNFLQKFM